MAPRPSALDFGNKYEITSQGASDQMSCLLFVLDVAPSSNGVLILYGDFASYGAMPHELKAVQAIGLATIGQNHLSVFGEDGPWQRVTDKLPEIRV